MSRSLRVLAALLCYPDAAAARASCRRCATCSPQERRRLAVAPRRARRADRTALQRADPLEAEAAYVELFDRGRATSLHLFEHVHGDSRDRGPAMIDLVPDLRKGGPVPGARRAARLPAGGARVRVDAAAARGARLPRARSRTSSTRSSARLRKRESPYASVLGALIELAGEKAQPVEPAADEPLDESWAEPPVFDGCSAKGQARPGQAQPIHVVDPASGRRRRQPATGAAT